MGSQPPAQQGSPKGISGSVELQLGLGSAVSQVGYVISLLRRTNLDLLCAV